MALYSSVGIEHGDRAGSAAQTMKNFELFGAPHVAIITTDEALGTYGAVDCGLYVNSFLLAAQSLGVATIPQAALAGSSKFIHEHFGIDDHSQGCLRDLVRIPRRRPPGERIPHRTRNRRQRRAVDVELTGMSN